MSIFLVKNNNKHVFKITYCLQLVNNCILFTHLMYSFGNEGRIY